MVHATPLPTVAGGRPGTVRLVVILGALAAFAPLSFDMYLPAFPALATDFEASASSIQLSLTTCLLGVAVGQLLFGSLSDALGDEGRARRLAATGCLSALRATRSRRPLRDRFVPGLAGEPQRRLPRDRSGTSFGNRRGALSHSLML